MSAILLLLLVLPGPLHITYLAWSYITPCLIFDFCNLLYLLSKIVRYFKGKATLPLEDTGEVTPVIAKTFTAPSNDIGDAHIQTVREVDNVEDLGQGHTEPSSGMGS